MQKHAPPIADANRRDVYIAGFGGLTAVAPALQPAMDNFNYSEAVL